MASCENGNEVLSFVTVQNLTARQLGMTHIVRFRDDGAREHKTQMGSPYRTSYA